MKKTSEWVLIFVQDNIRLWNNPNEKDLTYKSNLETYLDNKNRPHPQATEPNPTPWNQNPSHSSSTPKEKNIRLKLLFNKK